MTPYKRTAHPLENAALLLEEAISLLDYEGAKLPAIHAVAALEALQDLIRQKHKATKSRN